MSLRGPIFAPLRLVNTGPFEEMLQQWRAINNIMFDFTGLKFEQRCAIVKIVATFKRYTCMYSRVDRFFTFLRILNDVILQ